MLQESATIFYSNFDYTIEDSGDSDQEKHAKMLFSSTFKDIDTCAGDLKIRNCTLEPALLRQHIVIENGTLKLDPLYNYTSDEVVQSPILVSDITAAGSGSQGINSTHGGLAMYLQMRYNSEATAQMDEIYGLQVFQAAGSGAYMDYMTDAGGMGPQDARCNIKWRQVCPHRLSGARTNLLAVILPQI